MLKQYLADRSYIEPYIIDYDQDMMLDAMAIVWIPNFCQTDQVPSDITREIALDTLNDWSTGRLPDPIKNKSDYLESLLNELHGRTLLLAEDYITKATASFPPRDYLCLPQIRRPSDQGHLMFKGVKVKPVLNFANLKASEKKWILKAFLRHELTCRVRRLFDDSQHLPKRWICKAERDGILCVTEYYQTLYGAIFAHCSNSLFPGSPTGPLRESELNFPDTFYFDGNTYAHKLNLSDDTWSKEFPDFVHWFAQLGLDRLINFLNYDMAKEDERECIKAKIQHTWDSGGLKNKRIRDIRFDAIFREGKFYEKSGRFSKRYTQLLPSFNTTLQSDIARQRAWVFFEDTRFYPQETMERPNFPSRNFLEEESIQKTSNVNWVVQTYSMRANRRMRLGCLGSGVNLSYRRVVDYLWGNTSKEEKKLIRKLDFFILTFCCFSFFFNHLDRQAFANAYVAGLKEALDLTGNKYNVLLSMTSAGMLVGQIPSSIIIHKIRPRIWLSSMVVSWAGLTMASAACKTCSQLCAVRFFMGLAEASTYAGSIYIMGSWYKSDEIGKRTAMFTVAGQVGKMFAGAMMAAIHESMEGRAGLAGWQWVFLIDGIITLPVAIFGFFFFPDVPEYTDASYLDEKERQLALDRLPPKREDGHSIQAWSLIKRVLGNPLVYIFCVLSVLGSALQSYVVQGLMLLYLKFRKDTDGFTQSEVNTLPIPTHAVGIVAELSISFVFDRYNQRMSLGFVLCFIQIVCSIILLIPNMTVAGNLTALYLSASAYGIAPLSYGWASNILARTADDAARSVTLASMTAVDGLLWTFWGIVMFPADHAPYWRNGYIGMICVSTVLAGWLFVVRWVDRYTAKKYPASERMSASSLVPTQVNYSTMSQPEKDNKTA
ncbi:unnamed protein product [Fusarium langsethiae]|nr:unnamed protein product [Fusarium langsethiae]